MPNLTAERRDEASPVWDMSQERALLHGLLSQRFNFLLVFSSLIVAGAINAKEPALRAVVLTFGALVCCLLAVTLYVSNHRLRRVIDHVLNDPTHPAALSFFKGAKLNTYIIGYVIPTVLWVALAGGAVRAWVR